MSNDLSSAQEARLREIRAREVQQIGLVRSRIDGMRGRHAMLGRSLRGIDADIAAGEAALSVERRPEERAFVQQRLKERKVARAKTTEEMGFLNRQAADIIAGLKRELAKLRTANRIETERIRTMRPAEAEVRKLDLGEISKAFGVHGEMARAGMAGAVESISFRGVTWEGFGQIPTDNLTPKDIPYYMDKQDSEYLTAFQALWNNFQLVELKRREAISLYRNTGEPELKVAIELRETRYQAMKREVYQLKDLGNRSTQAAEAREPNRPMPGYRPPKSAYPDGHVQRGHGNPPTYHSKHEAPKFPVKDTKLDQVTPRVRQLNDEANQLAREYERIRPTMPAQRGFDERNANEVYAMDKLPTQFDKYTTPAGYRPPPPGTGRLIPMHAKEQDVTLGQLAVSTSGDLSAPSGGSIMGELGQAFERMGALVPITTDKPLSPVDRRKASEVLADALAGLKSFEEAH